MAVFAKFNCWYTVLIVVDQTVYFLLLIANFIYRLKDYPQYCQHLASISHFIQFPHHLQEVCINKFMESKSTRGINQYERN